MNKQPYAGQQNSNARDCEHDLPGELINNRYRVDYKIGAGSFGDIFLGEDTFTAESIAIKVESCDTRYPQLSYEYRVYKLLQGRPGIPKARYLGDHEGYTCLVMDLLGDSLEALYNKCGRTFSLKTIFMLAIQMLDRIELLHEHQHLHRDIKPDNFLMGRPPMAHVLYAIDMGLSKRYIDMSTGHIPFRDKKKLTGTPRYASINTHHGLEQCRRDDLEAMGYMLLYFLLGRLPWQGLRAKTKQEKYDAIGKKKLEITVESLCADQPREFTRFFRYVRQLGFRDRPDYRHMRTIFTTAFAKYGFKNDLIFDWMLFGGFEEHKRHAIAAVASPSLENMPSERYFIDICVRSMRASAPSRSQVMQMKLLTQKQKTALEALAEKKKDAADTKRSLHKGYAHLKERAHRYCKVLPGGKANPAAISYTADPNPRRAMEEKDRLRYSGHSGNGELESGGARERREEAQDQAIQQEIEAGSGGDDPDEDRDDDEDQQRDDEEEEHYDQEEEEEEEEEDNGNYGEPQYDDDEPQYDDDEPQYDDDEPQGKAKGEDQDVEEAPNMEHEEDEDEHEHDDDQEENEEQDEDEEQEEAVGTKRGRKSRAAPVKKKAPARRKSRRLAGKANVVDLT